MASLKHESEGTHGSAGHRVFLALCPPEPVQREVIDALHTTGVPLRWVDPRRLHLTLGFAEALDSFELATLVGGLSSRLADFPSPPQLQLAGVGHFGDSVLWLGVRQASATSLRRPSSGSEPAPSAEWLHDLSRMIGLVLSQASGAALEPARWIPHVTVARTSAHERSLLRAAQRSLQGFTSQWWRPDRVQLMESLVSQRHRHVTLESFALAAPPG